MTENELNTLIVELTSKGYKRFVGHYKNEDYGYWKEFDVSKDEFGDKVIGYQVAVLVWDWRKYNISADHPPYGIQYEYVGNDFTASATIDGVTPDKAEEFFEKFHGIVNRFKSE